MPNELIPADPNQPMQQFDDALLQTLHQALQALCLKPYGPADAKAVCVAYSTGPDSTALLHAAHRLHKLDLLKLRALHVNHGLHADSQQWQALAEQQCRRFNVPLTCVRVNVDVSNASMETAAREARYSAFAEHLYAHEVLLMAHHQRDQAETVLLHLLRGSGADGLCGMPQSRPLGNTGAWLLRPWLHCPPAQLHTYCHQHDLPCSTDSSNHDPQHDRGWLRSELLPLLVQRKPGAIANIALSARLQLHNRQLARAELDRLLTELQATNTANKAANSIDIATLLGHQSRWLQHDLIRHWLRSLRLTPPPRQQLDTLLSQLAQSASDKTPTLQQHDYSLARYQHRLHVFTNLTDAPLPSRWLLPRPWQQAQCGTLRLRPHAGNSSNHNKRQAAGHRLQDHQTRWPNLIITVRSGGERIRLADGHHHRVKKLLQQAQIPHWQRQRLPLVWHRHKLVAVADLYQHPALQRWLQRRALRLEWAPADELAVANETSNEYALTDSTGKPDE